MRPNNQKSKSNNPNNKTAIQRHVKQNFSQEDTHRILSFFRTGQPVLSGLDIQAVFAAFKNHPEFF